MVEHSFGGCLSILRVECEKAGLDRSKLLSEADIANSKRVAEFLAYFRSVLESQTANFADAPKRALSPDPARPHAAPAPRHALSPSVGRRDTQDKGGRSLPSPGYATVSPRAPIFPSSPAGAAAAPSTASAAPIPRSHAAGIYGTISPRTAAVSPASTPHVYHVPPHVSSSQNTTSPTVFLPSVTNVSSPNVGYAPRALSPTHEVHWIPDPMDGSGASPAPSSSQNAFSPISFPSATPPAASSPFVEISWNVSNIDGVAALEEGYLDVEPVCFLEDTAPAAANAPHAAAHSPSSASAFAAPSSSPATRATGPATQPPQPRQNPLPHPPSRPNNLVHSGVPSPLSAGRASGKPRSITSPNPPPPALSPSDHSSSPLPQELAHNKKHVGATPRVVNHVASRGGPLPPRPPLPLRDTSNMHLPNIATQNLSDAKKCVKCGEENLKAAKFCKGCGLHLLG
jgi:hypothetical protein